MFRDTKGSRKNVRLCIRIHSSVCLHEIANIGYHLRAADISYIGDITWSGHMIFVQLKWRKRYFDFDRAGNMIKINSRLAPIINGVCRHAELVSRPVVVKVDRGSFRNQQPAVVV